MQPTEPQPTAKHLCQNILNHKRRRNGQWAHANVLKNHLSPGKCQLKPQEDTIMYSVGWLMLERLTTSVNEDKEQLKLPSIAGGDANGTRALELDLVTSLKAKYTFWLGNSTPMNLPKRWKYLPTIRLSEKLHGNLLLSRKHLQTAQVLINRRIQHSSIKRKV